MPFSAVWADLGRQSATILAALDGPLLRLGQRLVFAASALDLHAPVSPLQPRFAFAVDIALVGKNVAAGVAWIDHRLKVLGVMLTGNQVFETAELERSPPFLRGGF